MTRVAALCLLVIATIPLTGEKGAQQLVGRVVQFNSPDDRATGIPGVAVDAFDRQGKPLAHAQTDGGGSYRLLGVGAGDNLVINHRKIGYLGEPEVWEGVVGQEPLTIQMYKLDTRPEETAAVIARRLAPQVSLEGALWPAWRDFRHFGLPVEARAAVKAQLMRRLGVGDEVFDALDASYTGLQVGTLDPRAAMAIARQEGLIPDTLFDANGAAISDQAKRQLRATAAFLRSAPGFSLAIEGHADEQGTDEYNRALAERRARAVGEYLASLGLDQERLTTASYGQQRPVCSDRDEVCRARNRRAHLELLKP
jgi:outer membrane protein OmpA-like peptidoglycan-associated protein